MKTEECVLLDSIQGSTRQNPYRQSLTWLRGLLQMATLFFAAAALMASFPGLKAAAAEMNPVQVGSWPGFTRGPAGSVAIFGNYAYVAAAGIQILDISDPGNPRRLGCVTNDWASLRILGTFCISGSYLFCSGEKYDDQDEDWYGTFLVFDISDPNSPRFLANRWTGGYITGIAVSGHYAYVADISRLSVYDIAIPSFPRYVGGYTATGYVRALAISGNYLYGTGARFDGSIACLHTIDISNPENPTPVGGIDTTNSGWDLALFGDHACVALGHGGVGIVNIANPNDPRWVASLVTPGYARSVSTRGNFAYVSSGGTDLHVVDVSEPANPKLAESFKTKGYFENRPAFTGEYAYFGAGIGGLQVLDISDPSHPLRAAEMGLAGRAMRLALSGNLAYVGEESDLQIIDISSSSAPRRLGGYATQGFGGMAIYRNYGYFGYYDDFGSYGLNVVDLSAPGSPVLVATVSNVPLWHVTVSGNYAYLPDNDLGLFAVDVSNPTRPTNLGVISPVEWNNFVVFGSRAYGSDRYGISLVDITQPLSPKPIGYFSCFPYSPGAVVESGSHAFLLQSDEGDEASMNALDISDPTNPVRVGQYDPQGLFNLLTVSDHYAYLGGRIHRSDHEGQLRVIDISNPRELKLVGQCSTGGIPHAIAVSGSNIYVAEDDAGLQVYTIPPVLTSIVLSGGEVVVSWEAFGEAILQRSPSLDTAAWEDVPGSETTNQMVFPAGGASWFFRLVRR